MGFAYQAIPDSPAAPPAAGQTQPTPDGEAPPAGGGLGALFPLLIFLPLLILLFWQSRSQQKKQAAAVADLKKGDKVLTQSGLVGRLAGELEGRYAKIEIASGVTVQVLRTSLLGRDPGEGQDSKK
jgi:preprotein translocase subunit YajC